MLAISIVVWRMAGPTVFCVLSLKDPINREIGIKNVALITVWTGPMPWMKTL